MTFKEQIELYLAPLPSEWKEKLTEILCEINKTQQTVDCEQVKDCETLTSFSAFSVEGSEISITYKDEDSVTVSRSVDLTEVINNQLEDLDPACLTDDTTWASLSYGGRLQLLINAHCECCSE